MRLLAFALVFSLPFACMAQDRSTPTKAWAVLEAAYKNKDVELIIAGRDFELESLVTFQTFAKESDSAMQAKKAAFVEAMVSEKIAKIRAGNRDSTGFPLQENTSCVAMPERVTEKAYVELELKCTAAQGKLLQPRLYFSQKNGQWLLFEILWN